MKLGVCGNYETACLAKKYGYDYVEENFTSLAKMSENDFLVLLDKYKKLDFPVLATNCLLPGDTDFYGKEPSALNSYLTTGFTRAKALGVEKCVFGSGGARNIPDNIDRETAKNLYLQRLSYIADLAKEYDLQIIIEPLCHAETNFIHTVKEGYDFAVKCGKNNVGVLVDFYHFYLNEELDNSLIDSKNKLWHAHLARPNVDRKMPYEEDLLTVKRWKNLLNEVDYDITLSLEGNFEGDTEKTLNRISSYINILR